METNSCGVYKKCSGCGLRNMSYEEQLKFKQVGVIRQLGKLCRPERIIGADCPEGSRCKVQIAYDFVRGRAVSGIYQSATGGVVPVKDCPVNDPRANRIGEAVLDTALKLKISVRCSFNGTGFLRHSLIRIAPATGEIMCVVVGTDKNFPRKKDFVRLLMQKCPDITTLAFSVSSSEKMTMGRDIEVLYGKGYIEDIILGKHIRVSPASFAQVTPSQAAKLYSLAIKYADLKGTDTAADMYCGTGVMTLLAADKAKHVYGCEINPSAVNDARENARKNGADNVTFTCADSGSFLYDLYDEGIRPDAVILDPARAGCDRKFLSGLIKLSPDRIVYVSCDPVTMSRDMFFMIKNGYRVKKLTPVDMFPFTRHVECVALLAKKENE